MEGMAVYGSTGSIGMHALEVIRDTLHSRVVSIVCNKNIDAIERQIHEYKPKYAGVINEEKARELSRRIGNGKTTIVSGMEECMKICTDKDINKVINSTVGVSGLVPTLEFIRAGKDVALANKESLVTGGALVTKAANENNMKIAPFWVNGTREGLAMYPIDSEHSAIWQCLQKESMSDVEKIILTASGGPFRKSTMGMLRKARPEAALKHPTWNMGGRITIDSATLMNKGFEIIEAIWLFGVDVAKVEVMVHPQSIVHSMVQFKDGNIKAQLSLPDMRLPIQYALTYPNRATNTFPGLDLTSLGGLEFYRPDMLKFKCLGLAYEAIRKGGTAPAVLNGADERAVELFLSRKIKFLDIAESVGNALNNHRVMPNPTVNDILSADKWARKSVDSFISDKYGDKHVSKSVS